MMQAEETKLNHQFKQAGDTVSRNLSYRTEILNLSKLKTAKVLFLDSRATTSQINADGEAEHSVPATKVYPHVFDENEPSGKAIKVLENCLNYIAEALDAIGEPNLDEMSSKLAQSAVLLNSIRSDCDFCQTFRSVISYIRRALLITSPHDVHRSGLNSIQVAIQSLIHNPMLSLDEATDITDKLTEEGWLGQLEPVNQMIYELFKDLNLDEEAQQLLFAE